LFDPQEALSPVQVIQSEPDQFAAAQTIGRCKVKDREVPSPVGIRTINRLQQCPHFTPRPSAGQLLLMVDPRRIDLLVQGILESSLNMLPLEKQAKRSHNLPHAGAMVRSSPATEKRFDMAEFHSAYCRGILLEAEMLQKESHLMGVV
jgi:hypothetical protein